MEALKTRTGRSASTREAIRTAAISLFAEKGYAATSTREICQRAGITKPVLYHHFGSKEQLYRELIVDACNDARKQLVLASNRGKTARQKILEVLAADFALTRANPGLPRMALRELFAPEEGSPALDHVELGHEWCRLMAAIVAEGVRQGEVQGEAQQIAELLMGAHVIYSMSFLLTGQPVLDRALAERIVDLLFRGCGTVSTDR